MCRSFFWGVGGSSCCQPHVPLFYFYFLLLRGKRQWRELLKRWCAPIGKCVADGEEELERADFPSSGELSLVAFPCDVKRTAFTKQHSWRYSRFF